LSCGHCVVVGVVVVVVVVVELAYPSYVQTFKSIFFLIRRKYLKST
jgi:hypothetical protein